MRQEIGVPCLASPAPTGPFAERWEKDAASLGLPGRANRGAVMSADIYTGWIVVLVDGEWRHAYVSRGFATLADFNFPNEHAGVFNLDDLAGKQVRVMPLERAHMVQVGSLVIDPDILDRIAWVRFGRVACTLNWGPASLRDSGAKMPILNNADDLVGLPEDNFRLPPPKPPERWRRTPRSMVVS